MWRLFICLFSLLGLLFAFVSKYRAMLLQQFHDLVFAMSFSKLEGIHTFLINSSKINALFYQELNSFVATLFNSIKEWSLSVCVNYVSISAKINQFFCRLIVSFPDAVKYRCLAVSVKMIDIWFIVDKQVN